MANQDTTKKFVTRGSRKEALIALNDKGRSVLAVSTSAPEITLERWSGVAAMKVKHLDFTGAGAEISGKHEWQSADRKLRTYPLIATEGMEDGGVEIEIELGSKPLSNVFDFQIENYEDLDFFYQPALTEEEIVAGTVRPDDVVGSYAVYHKTKKNHLLGGVNFATGKAYHIYRPKAFDALGGETWCDLSYSNGVLTVTVPQNFLNTATYPVIVDPTLGYTSVGASAVYTGGHGVAGGVYTASDGGWVTQMSVHLQDFTVVSRYRGVIWKHSDLSINPNSVSAISRPVLAATYSWVTADFLHEPFIAGATEYVIGPIMSISNFNVKYDTGAANIGVDAITNNYTTPTSLSSGGNSTKQYSVYITYRSATSSLDLSNEDVLGGRIV